MVGTLSRITTLLLAVGILLIGHGLQLTLLPIHAGAAGWSTSAVGITGSFYFLGFVAGCVVIPGVVAGVGHIRSFMVMAAIATVALLAAGLFVNVPAWIALRFASGFALSGLYLVIESWLSDVSPSEQRGTVLAIYTMISLVGMALGQVLIGLGAADELQLFMLGAVLISLAIVPIGLTRVASPHPIPSIRFTPSILVRASRVAVVCSFLAGMVTGAFWTLGPLLARAFGLDAGQAGVMMSLGISGGALSQLPVGRLSDLTDRRIVIGGIAVTGALVALAGLLFTSIGTSALYGLIFLFGATTMPLYALCIVHAGDNTDLSLVEVTSGILIVHSAGSILGPILVAALMDAFGPQSFFGYASACLSVAALWAFYRRFVVERPREYTEHAAILPRTTQAVAELSLAEPPTPHETWTGDK
jgi:MFS family permease